jgi:hypothetical protein
MQRHAIPGRSRAAFHEIYKIFVLHWRGVSQLSQKVRGLIAAR